MGSQPVRSTTTPCLANHKNGQTLAAYGDNALIDAARVGAGECEAVTYHEILEGQANQLSSRITLPGDDDFVDLEPLRRVAIIEL